MTASTDYIMRLQGVLASFNVHDAMQLSRELHEFERSGGVLTRAETELWDRMTAIVVGDFRDQRER